MSDFWDEHIKIIPVDVPPPRASQSDPEVTSIFEQAWRDARGEPHDSVAITLQPDGRHRVELLGADGDTIARTFAVDPNIACALADLYREKGVEAAAGCPCCEVLV